MENTCTIPAKLLKSNKEVLFEEIRRTPKFFLEHKEYYPLLFERDCEGKTGAHILAEQGVKELLSHKELWSLPDDFGEPVAFYMVKRGLWSLSPAFLSIRNSSGRTIAHELARLHPYLIYENAPFSFLWRDNRGWTVAHELAKAGIKFKISDPIVRVKTDDGVSVFAVMVYSMTLEELKEIPPELYEDKIGGTTVVHYLANRLILPKDKEKLLLRDKEGKTALFVYLFSLYRKNICPEEFVEPLLSYVKRDKLSLVFLAEKKYFSERKHRDILKMVVDENTGTTVAHIESASGKNFFSEDILQLTDKYGWTVAHMQALRGECRYSLKIKTLNHEGDTPAHVYLKKGHPIFVDDVFFHRNVREIPAWCYAKNPPDYFLEKTDKKFLKKLISLNVPAKEKIKEFLTKSDTLLFFEV